MDAYEQGQEAYYSGAFPELNPYDENDAQWDEWEDGWYDALHFEKKRKARKNKTDQTGIEVVIY